MTKSTKRSAARTRQRRHSPPTLYVDECLGRGSALRLQAEGHDARPFDEFAGKADLDFLPVVGERQWVLVTKDKNVRKNQLEVNAILNAGVRAFVITATGLNHQQISDLVSRAMPKIVRISRQQGPFVYNITATGTMSQISRRALERRAKGKKL